MLPLWLKFGRLHAARLRRVPRALRWLDNKVQYSLYSESVVKDAIAIFGFLPQESTCQVVNWPYREADSNSQYGVKC